MSQQQDSLLGGYRVLDLSDQTGVFAGRVLADMGADVIKIEKPGGDPMRNVGPFYKDIPGPERSLNWWIFNLNKRSVTLDIETLEGQEIFKKLVKTADFVIECFEPGHMDELGLGYKNLEKINPRIIVTSITPFGPTGPYAHWKGTDIIACAMGGIQWLCGDADRPPVRFTTQAAHFETSIQAVTGMMIAHYYREITGVGQYLDISIQEAMANTTDTAIPGWYLAGSLFRRAGGAKYFPPVGCVYPCQDGYIARWTPEDVPTFLEWMEEVVEIAPDLKAHYLKEWQAAAKLGLTLGHYLGREKYNDFKEATSGWLKLLTQEEIYQGAKARHFGWGPCYTLKQVLEGKQIKSRDWFVKVEHPELGETITYPGVLSKLSEAPFTIRRRAPLIGEHNEEVLQKELSLAEEKVVVGSHSSPADGSHLSGSVSWETDKKHALEGVKVLDLGWMGVWPIAAKYLGDHGAQVVRIEYPARLELRRAEPFKDNIRGANRSGYFNDNNTSKYGMTLDLKKPKALEVAKKLVAWADIVGEGYVPGVTQRWGLDYESCQQIKPDIVYVSSSGQGQAGPNAQHPVLGHILVAISGMNHFTGWPDRAPVGPFGPWTDFYVPYCILTTVVAALDRRRKTGRGMYIDASALEAALYGCFETAVLDFLVNGREQTRMGNRHPYAAPHGAYPCQGKDRWCSIAVFTDEEWQSFCQVIGKPQWTRDLGFATLQSRKQNEDELDRLVGDWTKNFSAEEVMHLMQNNGVPAGVVQTPKEVFEDIQLKHRQHFKILEHGELGPTPFRTAAFKLPKTPAQPRATHLLGEHNEYVLKNFLGMSDEEIAELALAEIFE